MERYLWGVAAVAVISALCTLLCPGGEQGGWGRMLRLLSGLCLLLMLIDPAVRVAKQSGDVADALHEWLTAIRPETESHSESPHAWDDARMDLQLAAYTIEQELCRAFSLEAGEITLGVSTTAEGDRIDKIRVGLSGSAIWQDSHAMEAWIAQNVGECAVEIYVE